MDNILKALTPREPEDIPEIRAMLVGHPLLSRMTLSDKEVEILWKAFSSDFCAGYLNVSSTTLKDFMEWVLQ